MFDNHFQPLHLDSNSNSYSNIHRPAPKTAIISPQLCIDLGLDPLNAFAQSNQVRLYYHVIYTKPNI
jgi:hypothetical protein